MLHQCLHISKSLSSASGGSPKLPEWASKAPQAQCLCPEHPLSLRHEQKGPLEFPGCAAFLLATVFAHAIPSAGCLMLLCFLGGPVSLYAWAPGSSPSKSSLPSQGRMNCPLFCTPTHSFILQIHWWNVSCTPGMVLVAGVTETSSGA